MLIQHDDLCKPRLFMQYLVKLTNTDHKEACSHNRVIGLATKLTNSSLSKYPKAY